MLYYQVIIQNNIELRRGYHNICYKKIKEYNLFINGNDTFGNIKFVWKWGKTMKTQIYLDESLILFQKTTIRISV